MPLQLYQLVKVKDNPFGVLDNIHLWNPHIPREPDDLEDLWVVNECLSDHTRKGYPPNSVNSSKCAMHYLQTVSLATMDYVNGKHILIYGGFDTTAVFGMEHVYIDENVYRNLPV